MNNQDAIKFLKQIMGWFATALMVVMLAKLFGWGAVASIIPGDVVSTGIAALTVGSARGWF